MNYMLSIFDYLTEIFIVGVIIYFILMFFIGQYFKKLIRIEKTFSSIIYYILFLIITVTPLISALDYIYHYHINFIDIVARLGFIIAAFFLYLALEIVVFFIIKLFIMIFMKKENYYIFKKRNYRFKLTMIQIILSFIICLIGLVGSLTTTYNTIDVGEGTNSMKIVVVSDIHYGNSGSLIDLNNMAKELNTTSADIVILVGDIFDNDISYLDKSYFCNALKSINSKYGVYAVTGNHEYTQNNLSEIKDFYNTSNVTLLIDQEVIIDNKIRLYGRDDLYHRYDYEPISNLSDSSLPLIVIDHQPQNYRQAMTANASLQISGHTHNGQMFPGDIAVKIFNKVLYDCPSNGLTNYDDFSLYITKGYGGWGFPMRLTGTREIAIINFNY